MPVYHTGPNNISIERDGRSLVVREQHHAAGARGDGCHVAP